MIAKIFLDRAGLIAAVVVGWCTHGALAQPPQVVPTPQPSATLPRPVSPARDCVLLRNDNILFGIAHQVGQYVVVRTGEGGEVQLPRQDVACWAKSVRDLYQFRVDQRKGGDVYSHLRDAKWCVRYDLFDLAAAEIAAVRAIDPQNPEAKAIEAQIRRATYPTRRNVPMFDRIETVNDEAGGPDLGGVDLDTLRYFAAHIQPTLMNRCGQCHSPAAGQKWTLMLPPGGSRASARVTRENLAQTLNYIDSASPEQSELWQKAVTPHGGSRAGLDPRHAKAIDSLKVWLAAVGQAKFDSSSGTDVDLARETSSDRTVTQSTVTTAPYIAERRSAQTSSPPVSSQRDSSSPARLPPVTNPFDPDLFNRRFHPSSR